MSSRVLGLLCAVMPLLAAEVPSSVPDQFVPLPFTGQKIEGVLGRRIQLNIDRRLIGVDEPGIVDPFRRRDGKSRWAGEHVGKFIEAATNAWMYSGSTQLKSLLDRVTAELLATQLPDGYLGTYTDDARWTSWDVWVHKYNLIGLLEYYGATHDPAALAAARKIGDLLVNTFGEKPGQRDIVKAGEHIGMAATSVLKPVVDLYRVTADPRYLEFARYIVRAENQPHAARIVRTLFDTHSVFKTANAKSYEMMSTLSGMLKLYRYDRNPDYLKAAGIAWNDIMERRLYIIGTTSAGEHFLPDYDLPADGDAHVGEGCVTFSWVQMNHELLRLTGEVKYAEELERTVFNALLGAQNPRDGALCSYPPLNGTKGFPKNINCCASSLPRAIMMIPRLAGGTMEKGAAVVLYAPGTLSAPIERQTVKLRMETSYPENGRVELTVEPQREAAFPLWLRVPAWTTSYRAQAGGKEYIGRPGTWLRIDRRWKAGDRVAIDMTLPVRALPGGRNYPDHIALQRGPLVMALEESANPALRRVTVAGLQSAPRELTASAGRYTAEGFQAVTQDGKLRVKSQALNLIPYMDAVSMRVWLPSPKVFEGRESSLFAFAMESASRAGDAGGYIADERTDTFRRTFDWTTPAEDWYAVEANAPVTFARIAFFHGKSDNRGGWFDTSAGKPRIQIKRSAGAEWETIGTLDSYPATNSAKDPGIAPGQKFEATLPKPVTAVALRIAGKPSSGTKDNEAYSSCAELAAYTR